MSEQTGDGRPQPNHSDDNLNAYFSPIDVIKGRKVSCESNKDVALQRRRKVSCESDKDVALQRRRKVSCESDKDVALQRRRI